MLTTRRPKPLQSASLHEINNLPFTRVTGNCRTEGKADLSDVQSHSNPSAAPTNCQRIALKLAIMKDQYSKFN
jgi:hypothetical protein